MHKTNQQFVADLFILSLEELKAKYGKPRDQRSLKQLQRYYRKKLSTMEHQPQNQDLEKLAQSFRDAGLDYTAEELSKAKRAGFHVGYIRNSEGEIEYTKPLPHVDFAGDEQESYLMQPVEPAIIRPSRAKPPKRDHKVLFVFSDAQIGFRRIDGELQPIHDRTAIKAAQLLCQDLKPDILVDCGDTTDFGEISRFGVDSDHFLGTLQPSLQETHEVLAGFTAASPNAERRVTVDSNHVKRLGDFVLKNTFPLFNIKGVDEEYPAMSYPSLLKLDKIGWEFVPGYGTAEYQYKDDLAFMHGTFAVSSGSTAAKLSKANYGRNIVQGHKHSIETHYHTDRQGKKFGAFVVGALCRTDGYVPSYHSAIGANNTPVTHYENWQQGVMVIRDYGEGKYQFDQVPIFNGTIYYNGKEYDGNE